jgi:DNA-3-methyladenine glycosylase I
MTLAADATLKRCPWPKDDALYVAYHDEEWGVPEYDDRALYEKLVLDGFQAGLSWITILRKRENFRRAFDGFVPEKIARYTPKKIERLMQDAGIVRNRAKIEGAVLSARAWLDAMEKGDGFSNLLWDFVGGTPKVNRFKTIRQIPAETPISRAMSKELAQRGFSSSAPQSSMRSCRRSAWSTIIWSPAIATRRCRSWRGRLTRHSGATRSVEPGIHNPCQPGQHSALMLRLQRIWIPDLSLRANPE